MTSFRLKQIGLALCLMMSLLIGHASACTCPHHAENEAVESDCHSHHGSAEMAEAVDDADACDTSCICFVEQPSPYVASQSPSREFKANDALAKTAQVIPEIEILAVAGFARSSPSSPVTFPIQYSKVPPALGAHPRACRSETTQV